MCMWPFSLGTLVRLSAIKLVPGVWSRALRRVSAAIGIVLIPTLAGAALSNFWISNGSYKLPREDFFPYVNCTTCTITRNWDGVTAKIFGAKNEMVGFVLYMGNATGADIPNVNVSLSSFTGPGGIGIVNPVVPPLSSTEMRPIETFYVRYIQIKGMTQLSWDGTEYEQRDLPERFRRPYTINVNDNAKAIPGTLWTDRPDHDKFLPEMLIPCDLKTCSNYTVSRSSSQAIWFDVWIASGLPAGDYKASITVKEGGIVTRTIPVVLKVYNFTLPDTASLPAIVYMSNENINYRHHGIKYPTTNAANRLTRDNYARFLHRHKFAATIGDQPAAGKRYPSDEYKDRLSGVAYSAFNGYAHGPGKDKGEKIYSIETYGKWADSTWSDSVPDGPTGFCTAVSSWSAYFANYPDVRAFLYLIDEPANLIDTHKWSTWMKDICALPHPIGSMVTASWPSVIASAPNVTMPMTTGWLRASSSTWDAAFNTFHTTGAVQAWAYNSHPSHTGSVYATEDDGIAPTTIFWAMHKKRIQGWFFWESTFWFNNAVGKENDLWNDAITFGYNAITDPVKGRTGFQASNGDGVLLYPGKDVIGSVNYGFDGPIASWRLKMLRRGIQDGDYLALANAASPTVTTVLVNGMVPEVLWEHDCFSVSDCSYAYGGRSWSNSPEIWERARETLALLAEAGPVIPPPPPPVVGDCQNP